MNVYQKLQAVQKIVTYVQKDANVGTGGSAYKAVTHDMVTALVRPHFVEQGIIVVPRLMSSATIDTGRKTSAGNPILRFEGLYEVSFVNADDPNNDAVVIPVAAHAEDQGDKAPGKALSYATKYAVLKVLMLETGESDESRFASESTLISADALKKIHDDIAVAKSIENLREIVEAGLTSAKEAGDHSAHDQIKAWGVARAATFGASAPNREPVKAKDNGKEAEKGEPIVQKPAPAGMLKLIRAKARAINLSEDDLLIERELETLDGISVALGNDILKTLSARASA